MSGTIWVLLRGLTREARHWGPFPRVLTELAPGARVIALDLPGNGTLHATRSPCSVPAMAVHVRSELHRRGLAPPYRVLAMSLGAMVATAWAEAAPDEIEAAVLINTSLRPFSPFLQRLRPANYATLLRLSMPFTTTLDRERAVLAMTSRLPRADDAALLEAWAGHARECPVGTANALRQVWAAARYRAPQHNPFTRVLLLGSAADALVDVRCTQILARAWSCESRLHKSAGHDLTLDDPAWVARQLHDWL
jgi:pimeloyl-ACP methyl ester carboxylesterase